MAKQPDACTAMRSGLSRINFTTIAIPLAMANSKRTAPTSAKVFDVGGSRLRNSMPANNLFIKLKSMSVPCWHSRCRRMFNFKITIKCNKISSVFPVVLVLVLVSAVGATNPPSDINLLCSCSCSSSFSSTNALIKWANNSNVSGEMSTKKGSNFVVTPFNEEPKRYLASWAKTIRMLLDKL